MTAAADLAEEARAAGDTAQFKRIMAAAEKRADREAMAQRAAREAKAKGKKK